MRLNYPWLQDPYYESENEKFSKREFLKSIDNFLNQRQYVKITLLDWNSEAPLKSIEGDIVSGSLTKEGSGAVRRAGNMSCTFSREEYNVDSLRMDYSLNKKIFVEIGIKNETNMYQEYPILWFPQGTFVISSISINSAATSAVNVSISFKDKMCLLDGTIGGKFPSTVILDEMDTQTTNGEKISKKVKIYDIIMEVVNHFGKESLENIVIEDIPDQIGRIIRWTCQDYPLYIARFSDGTYTCSLDEEDEAFESAETIREFQYGDDVGYIYEDFVYDSELTASSGSSITSVLDNIKNYLGNFEYFYDEYGVFHFREIKNYLNKSLSAYSQEQNTEGTYYSPYNSVISLQDTDYLMNTLSVGKTVYSFDDSINIISISNSPSYENIKNDFIVHGVRKGTQNSQEKEIFYHLAIDKKPYIKTEGYSNILVYKDPLSGFESLCIPEMIEDNVLPETGDASLVYGIKYSETNSQKISFEVPYTKSDLEGLDGETLKELTKKKKEAKDALSIYLKEITDPDSLDSFLEDEEKVCTLAFPGLEYELPDEDITIGKPFFSFSWLEDKEQKQEDEDQPLLRWLEDNEHFILSSNFFVLTEKIIKTPSFLSTEINPSFKSNVQEQIDFLKEDLLSKMFPEDKEDSSEDKEDPSEDKGDSSGNEEDSLKKKSMEILKKYMQILKECIEENYKVLEPESSKEGLTELDIEKTLLLGECCVNISEILLNHNVFASLYKADTEGDVSVLPSSTAFTKNIDSKKSAYQKMLKEKEREKALIEEEKAQIEDLIAKEDSLESKKQNLDREIEFLDTFKGSSEYYYKQIHEFFSRDFTEKERKKYKEEGNKFLEELFEKERSLKADALERIKSEKETVSKKLKEHQGDSETIEIELNKINQDLNKVNMEIAVLNENLDAIDIEIAWWENYFKLNSLKDDTSTEEEFPVKTVSFNINKGCRFWYWDDVWKELEWYEYYSGETMEEYVNFSSYDDVEDKGYPIISKDQNQNEQLSYIVKNGQSENQEQNNQSENSKPSGCYVAKDWRTEIILQGLQGYKMGRDKNSYYFEELIANWPSVYNLREQCFRGEEAEETRRFKSLTEGEYFLDFIDSSSNIFGEYCVDNIGRRQNIVTSNEINCLFEPEIWPIGFIVSDWVKKNFEYEDKDDENAETNYIGKIKATLQNEGREVLQIPSNNTDITDYLSTGGILNGAFPQIKLDLLQHTNYQKKLSITAIPVWYLEPNTRVNIKETSTNTFGDFMAQSLSYSLGPGGSMTVTCSETIEKM